MLPDGPRNIRVTVNEMRLLEVVLFTLGGVWQGIRQDFNLLEIAAIVLLWIALRRGWVPKEFFRAPAISRPWVAALAIAFGTVALRLALLPLLKRPVPVVADEFSHLLLADTLFHKRLANPVHPFWQFFESLHIIPFPHYASNYFPGHAAVLALSRWVVILALPDLLPSGLAQLWRCLGARQETGDPPEKTIPRTKPESVG